MDEFQDQLARQHALLDVFMIAANQLIASGGGSPREVALGCLGAAMALLADQKLFTPEELRQQLDIALRNYQSGKPPPPH